MGTSVKMIDEPYGHLAPDSEQYERETLDDFDRANVEKAGGRSRVTA
jgi:hypothetical protein